MSDRERSTADAPRSKRRGLRVALPAAVLLLVVVLALPALLARLAPTPPSFETAAAQRRDVTATVTATGTLQPMDEVEIGSQVSGSLAEVKVDYNSRVKAGEVLSVIDPASFQARVVQQRAAVARAEAAVRKASRELERASELFAKQLSSRADLDAAEATADQAKADQQQAQAALESAQVDLAHTVIRSPIDGVVISRAVETGQTVAASLQSPTLFVIARDLAHMKLETSVDEADVGAVRPGLAATFTVDAFPSRRFVGTVAQVRLQPTTTAGVVSYTTILHTENPDQVLLPGMTADVSIELGRRRGALCVPNAALRFRPTLPAGAWPEAPSGTAGAGAARGAATSSGAIATAQAVAVSAEVGASATPASAASAGATGAVVDTVYVAAEGPPRPVIVLIGLTDGEYTEIVAGGLKEGDRLVTGEDATTTAARPSGGLAGLFRPPGGPRPARTGK